MNNGLRVRRILPPVELCMCWGSLPRTCYATLLTVLSMTVNRGCLALRGTTFSSDPWGLCMVRTVSVRGMGKKSVMYSQIQMFIFGQGARIKSLVLHGNILRWLVGWAKM